MGIAKSQFNNILSNIFTSGNTIKLFSSMPNESTETGYVTVGTEYNIKSGDFTVDAGTAESAKNMMLYLCETKGGDGTAEGFGVFKGNSLLYFGRFSSAMSIDYNTVPTIKKYNGSDEGILVTMTSTDIS